MGYKVGEDSPAFGWLVGLLIVMFMWGVVMTFGLVEHKKSLEKLRTKAIHYNYATFDENDQWQWVVPEDKSAEK